MHKNQVFLNNVKISGEGSSLGLKSRCANNASMGRRREASCSIMSSVWNQYLVFTNCYESSIYLDTMVGDFEILDGYTLIGKQSQKFHEIGLI